VNYDLQATREIDKSMNHYAEQLKFLRKERSLTIVKNSRLHYMYHTQNFRHNNL